MTNSSTVKPALLINEALRFLIKTSYVLSSIKLSFDRTVYFNNVTSEFLLGLEYKIKKKAINMKHKSLATMSVKDLESLIHEIVKGKEEILIVA